jgi:RNA-directed DNA polymerase
MNFSQDICDYTSTGREKSSRALKSLTDWRVIQLARHYVKGRSTEYNDNRIAKASLSKMKCVVTKTDLTVKTLHCHHKIPIYLGGSDKLDNLVIVHKDVHTLIHATETKTIIRYIKQLCLKENEIDKINKLRSLCRLDMIEDINS